MSIQRVAIIFDNTTRPETTGIYCRRALGAFVEVEHFLPSELEVLRAGEFDLYLVIDDGLRYQLPDHLRPAAWWVIDTHMDLDWALANAPRFDFVFAAQKDGAASLREAGVKTALWLPLACDPEIHGRKSVLPTYDVSFVGNLFPGPRSELLEALQRRYEKMFVGNRYLEKMAATYSASKIVFNRSLKNDVNMRVFEALASGSLLVTNDLAENGQRELFREGVELVTYADTDDLLEKVAYYLEHDVERERIAASGLQAVMRRHTYLHRMQTILQTVERGCVAEVPEETPQVSACLVSWKRPENVRRIVEQLRQEPLIDDIVIWNNAPQPLEIAGDDVTVVQSASNVVTYGRYLAVEHAKHDVIYTQDDDCLVHNIGELYETFRNNPHRIAHGLKLGHLAVNAENLFGDAQMALVGWGGFFHREWTGVFDAYRELFGEDELLWRKADRLFSLLLNRRSRSRLADVTDLDGASGDVALSVLPDHEELTRQAITRALSLLNGPTEATPDVETTAADYYSFARPELLELIPVEAVKVLDVGCGAGALGASLKRRQAAVVWGVEREESVADVARKRLDHVLTGEAELVGEELDRQQFDCIVCGDVLEHMRAPERFLRAGRNWLKPEGRLIASIPNVRHHSVVGSLLAGNFTYESAGLLDQDHVRFFTRREIEKLLFRAGYELSGMQIVPGPGYAEWAAAGHPGSVTVGRMQIQGMSPAEAEEFYAYQYLITATPAPVPDYGVTSIILVTHNQLAYTRGCIDSVRHFTDEPYELIVVDNGSTDGTPEYLQSLEGARVILNDDNRGFPAAVNQGIEIARGRQMLLLNNDTLVTTGWLRRMLEALRSDPQIGLVGPTTNNISGEQQIAVQYDDLAQLDGFAWDRYRQFHRQRIETDRLVGFCLLIDRAVIDAVGALDERFGIGNFEDDDFCRRAIAAGYRAVIARGAFIHHFGSRTFAASGIDFQQLLSDNHKLYQEKWSEPKQPSNKPQTVSLCMIVRDNADTLEAALAGIQSWVDEMIVVDTGSIDETPNIAERMGANVYHFPWCDDFSAARNESLKYATGDWLFWMDSDDTIDEANGRKLRELVDGPHIKRTLGYVMQVHCPGNESQQEGVTAVDHVKLFRNRPDLRFEGRIHEQILPAIRRADGEVEFTDVFVTHSGSDNSPEGRAGKYVRDFRLLELELADHPDHPFALFNLGMTHADAGNHDEAVKHLERCLEVSEPGGSHLRKAYALLVSANANAERHKAAWRACEAGLRDFPDDPELLFRSGMLHHHFGRYDEAIATYQAVIDDRSERHFSSVDTAITGYKARHNLALVYEDLEQWSAAEAQWRTITEQAPAYRLGWRGLGQTLLKQNKLIPAKQLAARLCDGGSMDPNLRCEGWLLQIALAQIEGEYHQIDELFQTARHEYPVDSDLLREQCQWLFEAGEFEKAERELQTLWAREPTDGAVAHNLGSVYLALGKWAEAIDAFRASLQVRPNSAPTYQQLGQAYLSTGERRAALSCWQESLKWEPANAALRQQRDKLEQSMGESVATYNAQPPLTSH